MEYRLDLPIDVVKEIIVEIDLIRCWSCMN